MSEETRLQPWEAGSEAPPELEISLRQRKGSEPRGLLGKIAAFLQWRVIRPVGAIPRTIRERRDEKRQRVENIVSKVRLKAGQLEMETERLVVDREEQRRREKLERRIQKREDRKLEYAHEERMRELQDAQEARIAELKIRAFEAIVKAREAGVELTDATLLSKLIERSKQEDDF